MREGSHRNEFSENSDEDDISGDDMDDDIDSQDSREFSRDSQDSQDDDSLENEDLDSGPNMLTRVPGAGSGAEMGRNKA